ncbi:BTK motif [Pristimantis euphronides]
MFQMNSSVILQQPLIKRSQQKRRTSPANFKSRVFILTRNSLNYYDHRNGPTIPALFHAEVCCACAKVTLSFCCAQEPSLLQHSEKSHFLRVRPNFIGVRCRKEGGGQVSINLHPNLPVLSALTTLVHGILIYWFKSVAPAELSRKLSYHRRKQKRFITTFVVSFPGYVALNVHIETLGTVTHYIVFMFFRHVGYAPSSYLGKQSESSLLTYEWYNRTISRNQAEKLLIDKGKEGAFMVRDSRQPGMYTVSIFTKSLGDGIHSVKHYHIRHTSDSPPQYYLAEKIVFPNIPELINYHQHNGGGLVTRLRHPVCSWKETTPITAGLSYGKWAIDPTHLTFIQEIGSGQFGVVKLASWQGTKTVAVKMIREGMMSEEDFVEEAQVLMKISHSKLVQLLGVCTQQVPIFLVFEFMEHGSLNDFLRRNRGTLTRSTALGMCQDVCEGMEYLEASNFIHRDLAARNCLVGEALVVKVSDFGMTRFVLDDQYTTSTGTKFPVKWSAPEVFRFGRYSSKSDVWSYGVLVWEVFSEAKTPFEHLSNADTVEEVSNGLRLFKPKLASEKVYQFMNSCWQENPEHRPSFCRLMNEITDIADTEM